MTLTNESASTWDVTKVTAKKLGEIAISPFKLVWNVGKAIIGTEADFVGNTHRVFMPEDLATIGAAEKSVPDDSG
jgi:hypothetical protein